ncbi:hypothetical protein LCGC14_2238130, partial [marine sediment metagenome]
FRIQQSVPYDAYKTQINKLTQTSKNLFINMLGVEGFKYEGEPKTGAELQKIYHDLYDRLHQIELKKLLNEVTTDGITLDKLKLRKTLLKEAMSRNYPISDQELMHIDEELQFLAYSPSADKYESLLTSIVTNRVIRLKMPGKSFVLGSEEGFSTKVLTADEVAEKTGGKGIVYTSNWTGELLPARSGTDKNGDPVMLPAQAIVPWKFTDSKIKDKKGRIISIDDFTTTDKKGRKIIDFEKIPEDVLRLFGMRIPNQGPNSQSAIEIVGFLPEASGDLIIATKDYVVQMGSDFDVDKLYTYMYNVYVTTKGSLRKQKIEGDDTQNSLVLQNKIIDVHLAIHANTDSRVQSQIAFPLGFWILDDLSKDVEKWKKERRKVEEKVTSVTTQKFISRQDLRNNPDTTYLFGDNFEEKGLGGQAKEMRGEPNAVGIPSKKKPSNVDGSFFTDDELEANKAAIDTAFAKIPRNKAIVIPEDGLGTGLANLREKAPETFKYLQSKVAELEKTSKSHKMFTGLSDEYQREKFKNATAGKAGVSSFSVDSMFNAVAQGKALRYTVPSPPGKRREPLRLQIGKETSTGELSNELAMDGETFISDIIAGYQSAAVDNEK